MIPRLDAPDRPRLPHFDPALVEAPDRRGEVAWSLFNQH
jgi:hypothetical protein